MWALSVPDRFDFLELGPALRELRAAAPQPLLDAAADLHFDEGLPGFLLGFVYELGPTRTVDVFLDRLAATDPVELQLHLLGYHTARQRVTRPEVIRAAAEGDAAAVKAFLGAAEDWPGKRDAPVRLLELGADAVKERLLRIIPAWNKRLFQPLARIAVPALERDAVAKRRLARSLSPQELVARIAPGIRYASDEDVRRLVLFPTYWARPWAVIGDHDDLRIICYPVAAERQAAEGQDPAALARTYKALGDESRLRLLRLLADGPATLTEAAQEIGIAKSTTHHHLAILRHAGLVTILNDDRGLSYSLRPEAAAHVAALLEDYLGATARTART